MNMAFFETEQWEEELISKQFASHDVSFTHAPLTVGAIGHATQAEVVSVFIYSQLSIDLLSRLPNLACIATRSTGYEHIDLTYCKDHGITVCNVPNYGSDTIAEHTFALMLALSRNLIPSVERTRRGDFSLNGLRGFALAGKTLGIVGLGHIGMRVAQLAVSFKMNVLATTRIPKSALKQGLGITVVDLPTLLSRSDIVSLHVPLTHETEHLINKENIKRMKKGSFLINTARGPIVETEALLWALDHGILAGAGLDVLEGECDLKEERQLLTEEFLKKCDLKTRLLNNVLLRRNNVIVTPHNAFNSQEALTEIINSTIDNIHAWLIGKPMHTVAV